MSGSHYRKLVQEVRGIIVRHRVIHFADLLPSFHALVPIARQRMCLLAADPCGDLLRPHVLQRSGIDNRRQLLVAHLLLVYIPQSYHTAIALRFVNNSLIQTNIKLRISYNDAMTLDVDLFDSVVEYLHEQDEKEG